MESKTQRKALSSQKSLKWSPKSSQNGTKMEPIYLFKVLPKNIPKRAQKRTQKPPPNKSEKNNFFKAKNGSAWQALGIAHAMSISQWEYAHFYHLSTSRRALGVKMAPRPPPQGTPGSPTLDFLCFFIDFGSIFHRFWINLEHIFLRFGPIYQNNTPTAKKKIAIVLPFQRGTVWIPRHEPACKVPDTIFSASRFCTNPTPSSPPRDSLQSS